MKSKRPTQDDVAQRAGVSQGTVSLVLNQTEERISIRQETRERVLAAAKAKLPNNVKLFPWLPQTDLLGNPQTKVFITHCGNNGQYEALYHGVPMIGFPLYLDQPHNGYRIQAKGYGIRMDIRTFTAAELTSNILELIQNGTFGLTSCSFCFFRTVQTSFES